MTIANPVNASPLMFPILECVHIAGFVLVIGCMALVDFRLLNWVMRRQTAAELADDTAPWTLSGWILVVSSGLLLYSSDPDMYYLNLSFQLKIVSLAAAIVFHYTIERKVVLSGASPGKSKLVALVSLALWAGVLFGGTYIGFVGRGITF
jgi:hypothetical protein